jgi:hypothetical protein
MSDMNGVRLSEVKGGQTVKLGMKYQVNIPMYSKAKTVKVTDYNTLVLPDGRKMDQPKLTRNRVRLCEEVYSDVSVKIYDNVPLGPYVHIASVEINGRRYEERQILNIIKRD